MLFCPDRVIVLNIYDVDFFFPVFIGMIYFGVVSLWHVLRFEVHIHLRY